MRDLIVTTPKGEMATAAAEGAAVLAAGGGFYFRRLPSKPKDVGQGSLLFYVEDGYIRGYALIQDLLRSDSDRLCEVSGRNWPPGWYLVMDATTWCWIKPIPMKGFQGWRYYEAPTNVQVVGGWKDPKPAV